MGTEELLGNISLFKHLRQEQLSELARLLTQCTFAPGEDILRDGDPGDGLYIVTSGLVKVTKKSPSGQKEAPLALLKRGEVFGEMALLDDQPRSATVTAMGPTECLFLSRGDFINALQRYPEIAVAMLPVLAERIRTADRWIEHLV
ncbi:MAG: cyclic nucleotide-binding domain-containing protein [Chloroflexi bacterium]|nr:cyclic nucleotide-binding domain-containing protein [Chloroflexota bacterium]